MATDGGVKLFSGSKRKASLGLQANSDRKRQHERPATQSLEPLTDGTAPSALQDGQALEEADANAQVKAPASFKALGLSDWLDRPCKSLGMTQPTEVQKGCIPSILKGRDVIGTAHTGSGKTAAFALPILQRLAQDPYGVYALVLTPTRCLFQLHIPFCHPMQLPAVQHTVPLSLVRTQCKHQDTLVCRELAFQLADQFRALGSGMPFKVWDPALQPRSDNPFLHTLLKTHQVLSLTG